MPSYFQRCTMHTGPDTRWVKLNYTAASVTKHIQERNHCQQSLADHI